MKRQLDVMIGNSSGNVTIMVLTPAERSEYASIACSLLENQLLDGEQVAFVLEDRMEMCGLEFCGNASRAYALWNASRSSLLTDVVSLHEKDDEGDKTSDDSASARLTVSVSGCNHPLTARIFSPSRNRDIDDSDKTAAVPVLSATVEMDMPVPSKACMLTREDLGISRDGLLVDMDGISHLVLTDVAPSAELFDSVRNRLYHDLGMDMAAFGIMFCDTVNRLMTPVVYVRDVDTTYFEGSCASGSVAASYALAMDKPDGVHSFVLQQPEGVLSTAVTKENGDVVKIALKGSVSISDMISIDLEY